ncbi:hypothetical protein FBR05_01760 [Deltaproteobacteria bacterium PRO3]|nr:hypothetical protein [Deltaproteobacteria bacterium PRO3]
MKEYLDWLKVVHEIDLVEAENYYNLVVPVILEDFKCSPSWKWIIDNLKILDGQYLIAKGYDLLPNKNVYPELLTKSFQSVLSKTFRKNILGNESFPDPPKLTGWILPGNCLSKINDVIRTTIVVKYLDGIEFLAHKLKVGLGSALCGESWEAREVGYYAAHTYLTEEFEIPNVGLGTTKIKSLIEIQITTQIKDTIKSLLHHHYEERRITMDKNVRWQWDYNSEEFSANYLGHILHFADGLIVKLRKNKCDKEGR